MVGPCRYQFFLQWVVFCWCTQKGRQILPSWAQKQGTPEEEWTHSAEVESSLHLCYDCNVGWNILKGFLWPNKLDMDFCLSIHVHSPLIELKDELSSWRREDDSQWPCTSASESRDAYHLGYIHFHTQSAAMYHIFWHFLNAKTDYSLVHRYNLHDMGSYLFKWVKCL